MYLLLGSAALFVGALPFDEHAQASPSAIPDNARKRSYGWDCNRGFRETGGNCVAVIVPANAYLSPEGTSWTCNRGFRPEGAACKAVQAPANALRRGHAGTIEAGSAIAAIAPSIRVACNSRFPRTPYAVESSYGRGWECERGYRESQDACVAVEVPADAYLVGGGNDWKCERGFRRIGERCNAIAVPVNAYLNDLGSDWRCERGFRKDGLGCAALRVPDHGFINYSGDDWSCEEGFRRQESACLALPSSP